MFTVPRQAAGGFQFYGRRHAQMGFASADNFFVQFGANFFVVQDVVVGDFRNNGQMIDVMSGVDDHPEVVA